MKIAKEAAMNLGDWPWSRSGPGMKTVDVRYASLLSRVSDLYGTLAREQAREQLEQIGWSKRLL
jgi:hypothetical protein